MTLTTFHSMAVGLFQEQIVKKMNTRTPEENKDLLKDILEDPDISLELRAEVEKAAVQYFGEVISLDVASHEAKMDKNPAYALTVVRELTTIASKYDDFENILSESYQHRQKAKTVDRSTPDFPTLNDRNLRKAEPAIKQFKDESISRLKKSIIQTWDTKANNKRELKAIKVAKKWNSDRTKFKPSPLMLRHLFRELVINSVDNTKDGELREIITTLGGDQAVKDCIPQDHPQRADFITYMDELTVRENPTPQPQPPAAEGTAPKRRTTENPTPPPPLAEGTAAKTATIVSEFYRLKAKNDKDEEYDKDDWNFEPEVPK